MMMITFTAPEENGKKVMRMDEYIDRESLIKRFCERCNEEMSESPCEPSDCFAREVIKTAPAADVAPVRHGRWVHEHISEGYAWVICSECEAVIHKILINKRLNYCPNCGAKMDL